MIAVGVILVVCIVTCCCFYCACCTCFNNKGDISKFGMCNRWCPWMPCSDPPPKVEEAPAWHYTPETVDENRKSLFGRASALNLAAPSKEDASADPEKGRGATSGGVNPMTPKGSFSVPKGDKSFSFPAAPTNGSGDSSPSSPKAGAKKALLPKKDEEEEEEGEGSDDSNAAEAKAKAKRKKAKKETSQAITAAAAEESD